jgi:hypothetical protein
MRCRTHHTCLVSAGSVHCRQIACMQQSTQDGRANCCISAVRHTCAVAVAAVAGAAAPAAVARHRLRLLQGEQYMTMSGNTREPKQLALLRIPAYLYPVKCILILHIEPRPFPCPWGLLKQPQQAI